MSGDQTAHGYAYAVASVTHSRLSVSEFEAILAKHGGSFEAELIDGQPVVIPPDHLPAASAQGELYFRLRGWQARVSDSGLVIQSTFVRIDATSTLGPDIAWWSHDRRPPLVPGTVTAVPDWVAEILSPSTRRNDLGPKRVRYLAAGVRELWLVDPAAGTIVVTDADGSATTVSGVCSSRVLDGFSVETASLFVD